MKFRRVPVLALMSIMAMAMISLSESIPAIRAQSFADAQVDLPADLHGRIGVLVIGFSKKSSLQTKQWNDALLPDYENDPHVAYYQLAGLADVPSFIRGVVLRGIRNSMTPAERTHFIAILQDEAKWKEAARFASPDEAYVLVIDSAGQIKWRTHGVPANETYRSLKDSLAKLQGAN